MSNFEVLPPKCKVILLGTAQREDVFNQQERKKLSKRCPTFKRFAESSKRTCAGLLFFRSWEKITHQQGCSFKIVKQYNLTGSRAPKKLNHVRTVPRCTFQDSILLETMVQARGLPSLKELRDDLAIHGDCRELSTSTEILGTDFQVTATIPEEDWGNVRQSVLLPKI